MTNHEGISLLICISLLQPCRAVFPHYTAREPTGSSARLRVMPRRSFFDLGAIARSQDGFWRNRDVRYLQSQAICFRGPISLRPPVQGAHVHASHSEHSMAGPNLLRSTVSSIFACRLVKDVLIDFVWKMLSHAV
jgi:hypothetical protein